jgi:hypothetical protein
MDDPLDFCGSVCAELLQWLGLLSKDGMNDCVGMGPWKRKLASEHFIKHHTQ